MTKRVKYVEIDGEMVKQEIPVFSYCSCVSESGYDLVKVPYKVVEGHDVCGLCNSSVVWTNQEEITSNERR